MASLDINLSNSVTSWSSVSDLAVTAAIEAGYTETYDVGTALIIQNKGIAWVILQSSETQPDDDDRTGTYLTNLYDYPAITSTNTDDNEYWVRPATYGLPCVLNIQEA